MLNTLPFADECQTDPPPKKKKNSTLIQSASKKQKAGFFVCSFWSNLMKSKPKSTSLVSTKLCLKRICCNTDNYLWYPLFSRKWMCQQTQTHTHQHTHCAHARTHIRAQRKVGKKMFPHSSHVYSFFKTFKLTCNIQSAAQKQGRGGRGGNKHIASTHRHARMHYYAVKTQSHVLFQLNTYTHYHQSHLHAHVCVLHVR